MEKKLIVFKPRSIGPTTTTPRKLSSIDGLELVQDTDIQKKILEISSKIDFLMIGTTLSFNLKIESLINK